METIKVQPVAEIEYRDLSLMIGELLSEIMDAINEKAFNYDPYSTEERARDLIERGVYWVLVAKDALSDKLVGFVSLYESYALYSEGAYGTIPELYVRKAYRSTGVGEKLIQEAMRFGKGRGWRRLEVTTPPLPQFDRTLNFYQSNGFQITGGRKLKVDINA